MPNTGALLSFLYSAPWVKPSLPCRVRRKREWTSESEEDSEDDLPGSFDSVPWVESGLMPKTTGQKRKRESSTESEEELEVLDSEPNHPWDVDSLCGLKMKLKKRRMDLVQPEHHEVFSRLLGRETPQGVASNPALDTKKKRPVTALFQSALLSLNSPCREDAGPLSPQRLSDDGCLPWT